ncbi:MAG TPA: hypothetical protein VFE65_13610 [Pseudonocardia sp.]|nr:hypothetical protein [Pseudonocardia sp.]
MSRGRISSLVSVAVGAGSAVGCDWALRSRWPRQRVGTHALGLGVAAAIYPALRSGEFLGRAGVRELAALGGYSALGVVAVRSGSPTAARVVSGAWASHALFDAAHRTGSRSRIPRWYPALCAGYDLAVAALIWRGAQAGPR